MINHSEYVLLSDVLVRQLRVNGLFTAKIIIEGMQVTVDNEVVNADQWIRVGSFVTVFNPDLTYSGVIAESKEQP